MKRSEMVRSLATKLFADVLTDTIDLDAAHHVLLFLENSGMRPPTIQKKVINFNDGWRELKDFNEWEPE